MSDVVVLSGTCKRFTVGTETLVAADYVDLTVREGELVCVYGASGSGKTTLLNIVAGICLADSGDVTVGGTRLGGLSEGARADVRLRHTGVVFQADNLLPEFTARENVMLPLLVRGTGRADAVSAADSALADVGLAGVGGRLPGGMSGGQRQRVGIARALAGRQRLLVADEPTGALDSDNSRLLFALLRRLCDEHGTAVLLATHDPLAEPYADRTLLMVDGKVTPR